MLSPAVAMAAEVPCQRPPAGAQLSLTVNLSCHGNRRAQHNYRGGRQRIPTRQILYRPTLMLFMFLVYLVCIYIWVILVVNLICTYISVIIIICSWPSLYLHFGHTCSWPSLYLHLGHTCSWPSLYLHLGHTCGWQLVSLRHTSCESRSAGWIPVTIILENN